MLASSGSWSAVCAYITAAPANAGPAEDETFAAFEWFCLAHLNKSGDVPGLFDAIGIKRLPEDYARPFLTGHSGSAWFLPGTDTRLVVTLTDKGACGVPNPEVDGIELKRIFESLLRNRSLNTSRIGSETTTTYAVTYPDRLGGPDTRTVVLMTTSVLASVKGANLGAVPERIMVLEGLKIPNWPQGMCEIDEQKKRNINAILCGQSAPESDYRFSGPNCVVNSFRKRLEDTAIQIHAYRLCGEREFSDRLKEANLKAMKFMETLSVCISERVDLAKMMEDSLTAILRRPARSSRRQYLCRVQPRRVIPIEQVGRPPRDELPAR